MTSFLFTTLPTNDLGLLTRSLPVALELTGRGHTVVFCSPGRAPRRLIAEAGFENQLPQHPIYDLITADRGAKGLLRLFASRPWRARHSSFPRYLRQLVSALPRDLAPASPEVWNMDHAGAQTGMASEGFVRAHCGGLQEVIEGSGADVVVDFWNPLAVIAARACRKPLVTVIQADAHPQARGFLWWKEPPADLPTPVPVVNRVLSDYGLPAIRKLEDLSRGDLTLVVGMPETDPLPETADVTYLGALLWEKPGSELPEWISELDSAKPLVWLYTGNPRYSVRHEFDSVVVLRASIEALAGAPLQVVVTTGHHPLPKELRPLPANFRHAPYLPGLSMAERSDLLIHHGGYGSCQTGLYVGKPAVILPTYSERESNARRIEALGAGLMVEVEEKDGEKRVDAAKLRSAVDQVLADRSFSERAMRISERLRAYGGATLAADLIERFAAEKAYRKAASRREN